MNEEDKEYLPSSYFDESGFWFHIPQRMLFMKFFEEHEFSLVPVDDEIRILYRKIPNKE